MTPGPRWIPCLAVLIVAACATSGPGGGDADNGSGTRIDRVRGRVRLGTEYKSSRSDDLDQILFNELIGADIAGQLYHARLLKFSLGGDLAWTQADVFGDQAEIQTAFLPGYRVRADFLPEHPVRLSLFALLDQQRTIIPTATVSSFVALKERSEGGTIGFGLKNLTGDLNVDRVERKQASTLLIRREVRDTIMARMRHNVTWSVTRLKVGTTDVEEEPTAQEFSLDTVVFTNLLRAGPASNPFATLRTSLQHFERDGTSAYKSNDAATELSLWIQRRRLRSSTRAEYNDFESFGKTRHRLVGQEFYYRLFDSLETTLDGFVSNDAIDESEVERIGAGLDFDYVKFTSYGSVQARYGVDHVRQTNTGSSTAQVQDEAHTLSITTVSLLANPDVITSTVAVTDTSGAILYTEGFDYELFDRGAFTEIARLPSGAIPEGGNVLVDYAHQTPSDVSFDRSQHRALVQVGLNNGLLFAAEYDRKRNDVREGDPRNALEELEAISLTAQYNSNGLLLSGEYLDYDSSLTPFRQTRLELLYGTDLGRRSKIVLRVADLRTFFKDGGDVRTDTFNLQLRVTAPPRFTMVIEPAYRNERGRGNDRDLFSVRLDATYRLGDVSMHLRGFHEFGELNSRGIGQTFVSFYIERKW